MAHKKDGDVSKRTFKIRYIFYLLPVVMLILAVFSHTPEDLAVLEGGSDAPIQNLIGLTGANIARASFYLFGIATYPILIIFVVCAIRGLLPFELKRRFYVISLIAAATGLAMLYAVTPGDYVHVTDRLGIGRAESAVEDLALSGGVIGAFLAAPPAITQGGELIAEGFVRRFIGVTGALIVAWSLLIPCVILVLGADWLPVILRLLGLSKKCVDNIPVERIVPAIKRTIEGLQNGDDDENDDVEKDVESVEKPSFFARVSSLFKRKEQQPESEDDEVTAPPDGMMPSKQQNLAMPVFTAINESARNDADDDDYSVAPPAPMGSEVSETSSVMRNIEDADGDGQNLPIAPPVAPIATPIVTPIAPTIAAPVAAPDGTHVVKADVKLYSEDQQTGADHRKPKYGMRRGLTCPDFVLPPVSLLDKHTELKTEDSSHIEASRDNLQTTLDSFNVEGHVSGIVVGPRVTRFEISLAPGVMVEKVTRIQNNIAMNLEAESIRILAPIPGKNTVGIEVPNKVSSIVYIRSLMESQVWRESGSSIPIILGRDIAGKVMITDLAKAPHLLIAGSTGSGKSVCMNTLIMSLLFRFSPEDLRLILVDPKVVELEMYKPLPHLITPVVNDPKKVPLALRWGVNEMERRYQVLAKVKAKNLAAFNSRPAEPVPVLDADGNVIPPKLPLLIIIVDELADIMMTEAKSDVETSICRIAQKGRAAGIHLVIATQTPRKDIVTGLIKANLPTKIAFKVGSNMDSRVILDASGAEKLLGYGDMLFKPPGAAGLERIQGSMVTDPEIQKVVDFVSGQADQLFDDAVVADNVEVKGLDNPNDSGDDSSFASFGDDDEDISNSRSPEFINSVAAKYLQAGDSDLMRRALEIIINEQKASTSYLQRRLGIGYNKSAELMDRLEERGIVSAPLPGGQKREILVTDGLETDNI